MNALICLLALAAGEPAAAAAPPEIRLANSATDIEFGVSILLDTAPSTGVHRMKWEVWPEKYATNLVEIAPGKTLFTCTLPGRYVFYGAASNTAGDLTTLRHSVRILPPGQELLESMKRDAESTHTKPAGYDRTAAPAPKQAIQQPEAVPGLRGDVASLLEKVESYDVIGERPRVAAAYDAVGVTILSKRPSTPEQSLSIIDTVLVDLEPSVKAKWQPFAKGVRQRLAQLATDGKLPDHNAFHKAVQTVQDVVATPQ